MSQVTPTERQAIPAPESMQNCATRVVASTLGILAGLLGLIHGCLETRQGNVTPSGIFILAVGPPCQANREWHSCFPAMTIIPNFFVTGVLAIIVSLIVILWATAFVQRQYSGLFLILLSIIQFLVGGGYISLVLGIVAGVVGTRIQAPFTWWRAHLSVHWCRLLATLWPWSLIAFIFWLVGTAILGYFFNEFVLSLAPLPLFTLGLLLMLAVLTGFAHDIQGQTNSHQV
jgi:hypothetical protein